MAGWEDLEAIPTDIRDATQKTEDISRLCLRVFGDEDGQKLLEWLVTTYTDQPVAVPGADASYAYYREGQNSVIRDFVARITKARSL
jgi:hypothetical protein